METTAATRTASSRLQAAIAALREIDLPADGAALRSAALEVAEIVRTLDADDEVVIAAMTQPLLDAGYIEREGAVRIEARPKHIFSIWRKMQAKQLAFEQLMDIRAARVLVNSVADCYAALGVVHSLWPFIPGEFDDYIATPKDKRDNVAHMRIGISISGLAQLSKVLSRIAQLPNMISARRKK
jgi:(p)ppGpp synthase/HD superfamily hydrolase